MNVRVCVLFSGNVQGVGFRYTAERMARRRPVTGYVRNLPRGQVELVAEGEKQMLSEFVEEVRSAFHSYVREAQIRWEEATGEYERFGIKF